MTINFQSCKQNENWQELLKDKDSPIHEYDVEFIKHVAQNNAEEDFKNQKK